MQFEWGLQLLCFKIDVNFHWVFVSLHGAQQQSLLLEYHHAVAPSELRPSDLAVNNAFLEFTSLTDINHILGYQYIMFFNFWWLLFLLVLFPTYISTHSSFYQYLYFCYKSLHVTQGEVREKGSTLFQASEKPEKWMCMLRSRNSKYIFIFSNCFAHFCSIVKEDPAGPSHICPPLMEARLFHFHSCS